MTRYQWEYTARLVPLNVPLNIPARDGRPPFSYTFDHQTFAVEQASKRVIPVCDDHQRHKEIGRVDKLIAQLGFWEAEFSLDPDMNELEIGQPVSVALSTLGIGSGIPFITEISVVPHGAVKGAVVRNRRLIPTAKPEPPKPTAASNQHSSPQPHPPSCAATRPPNAQTPNAPNSTDDSTGSSSTPGGTTSRPWFSACSVSSTGRHSTRSTPHTGRKGQQPD